MYDATLFRNNGAVNLARLCRVFSEKLTFPPIPQFIVSPKLDNMPQMSDCKIIENRLKFAITHLAHQCSGGTKGCVVPAAPTVISEGV